MDVVRIPLVAYHVTTFREKCFSMTIERIKRRIERLLDQVEQAADSKNWQEVHDLSRETLALDRGNADAVAFLEMAPKTCLGSQPRQPPPERRPPSPRWRPPPKRPRL